ncbi:MAG TPA: VOC family protein [Lysobacter sp.]
MSAAPFRLLQLDHVVLRVRDPAAMEAFYCGVLGCNVERRVDAVGLLQLRAGNSLIDLVAVSGKIGRMGGAAPGAEGRNMDHLCLRADPFDRDAIVQYLQSHGVEIGEFGRRYGAEGEGPSQYLLDPEGNLVELKGPPDEVPIDTAASNAST